MAYKVGDVITYQSRYIITGIGKLYGGYPDGAHPCIQIKEFRDYPRVGCIDLTLEGHWIKKVKLPPRIC